VHLLNGERRASTSGGPRARWAIGIEAFAERARRELAATGETVRRRTVETTVELTPQEAQIAGLAARSRWPRRHV
jgi:hypothetical protein